MSEENYIVDSTSRVPVKMWTRGVPVEEAALQQLRNVASLPFVHKHVAALPDVHFGIGATVGSVIPTKGAIIPAAVGVDIGCGMIAARTTLTANDLPDSLAEMRSMIEHAVPHGRTNNGGPGDRGAWHDVPDAADKAWGALVGGFLAIQERQPKIAPRTNPDHHLGTLGGGNHFIEVCLDKEQSVWIMLHSGSRGIGNRIGQHFIELAREDMRKWFVNLPDVDLAYFPEGTEHFDEYVAAVGWAQNFAAANRAVMLQNVKAAMARALGREFALAEAAVQCHHNYVELENHFGANVWVTRKGAVRAREGELGIIPGSMGARSFIVRGKGNADSFHSCSHGAGRVMSRTRARAEFTVEQHALATAGVECRKDESVLDETPAAYKSIDAVMAAQTDLVDVVHELRQVLCVKG